MYKSDEELAEMEERIPTKGVKDLIIVPDGIYGMFKIKWEDGRGVLPDVLKGHYTSMGVAEKAIKRYVDNHTPQTSKSTHDFDGEAEARARYMTLKPKETKEDATAYSQGTKEKQSEEEQSEEETEQKEVVPTEKTGLLNSVFSSKKEG